jgi:hypothetical protein
MVEACFSGKRSLSEVSALRVINSHRMNLLCQNSISFSFGTTETRFHFIKQENRPKNLKTALETSDIACANTKQQAVVLEWEGNFLLCALKGENRKQMKNEKLKTR